MHHNIESNQEVIYSFCLRAFTESVSHQLATQTTKNLKANERTAIISNKDEHILRKFEREEFRYPELKSSNRSHIDIPLQTCFMIRQKHQPTTKRQNQVQ